MQEAIERAEKKTITKRELLAKVKALKPESDEQRNSVVCALIGHSMIQTTCFGYFYCGRCGAQVGDNLGSVYSAEKVVIIGHNCEACQENFKRLTWQDKLFVPDPFADESASDAPATQG